VFGSGIFELLEIICEIYDLILLLMIIKKFFRIGKISFKKPIYFLEISMLVSNIFN